MEASLPFDLNLRREKKKRHSLASPDLRESASREVSVCGEDARQRMTDRIGLR